MFAVCELKKGAWVLLTLINIDSLIKAKQFKSMHKILNAKNDNWNSIGKWWLKKYDQIYNTEYFLTTCSDFKGLQINKFPIYYQNLPKSWSNFLLLQKLMTKLEVLNQPLYGNSTIVFNGKPIVFPNFAKSGIHKVCDIWDCETII